MSEMPDNKRLGIVLRTIREGLDYTQSEMAKKLNTTTQSVSNYENGKRTPSAKYVNGISAIAKMSVDSIYELANDRTIGIVGVKSKMSKAMTLNGNQATGATAALTKAMTLLESGLITAEKFDQILKIMEKADNPAEKEQ